MLPAEVKPIRNAVLFVRSTLGFTFGLYLFTYGQYFYDHFGSASNATNAMLLVTVLLAIRQGLVAILEVPTGALGDALGRASAVKWSFFFRMLFFAGLALLALCPSVTSAFLLGLFASIAFSLASSLFNGNFTAWIVDSMREVAPDIGSESIISRGYNYEFFAQIFGCLVGFGCMATQMTFMAYLLGASVCITCVTFCSIKMKECTNLDFVNTKNIKASVLLRRMAEVVGVGWQTCRKEKRIFPIVFAFSSFLFLVNVVDYLWPVAMEVHFGEPRFSSTWLFMILSVSFSALAGSQVLTWINNFWLRRKQVTPTKVLRVCMILTCITVSIPLVLLATIFKSSQGFFPAFAASVLCVELAYGIVYPCYESLINRYIPDSNAGERSTILSTGSLIRSLVTFVLAIPSGGGGGATTMNGWLWPAGLVVVTTTWMFFKLRQSDKLVATESQIEVSPVATP